MKLYKRKDFVNLPANTIYSKVDPDGGELCIGLYCKESGPEVLGNDWYEQDLIAETGHPLKDQGINDGLDNFNHVIDLRDSFKTFRTDLQAFGRDGLYEDKDAFVVWDKSDVLKLINYLTERI